MDVSDRTTKACVMSKAGGARRTVEETTIPTTGDGLRAYLSGKSEDWTVVFETGRARPVDEAGGRGARHEGEGHAREGPHDARGRTQGVRQVHSAREAHGMGILSGVALVASIDADPSEFRKARDAGACFGLVPRQGQSGGGGRAVPHNPCRARLREKAHG